MGAEGRLTHIVSLLTLVWPPTPCSFTLGQANLDLAGGLGVRTTRNGTIRTRGYGKTNVPGVSARDTSRHVQLADIAAGEGAAAACAINTELLKQDLI